MRRRLVATGIMLALAVAAPKCKSDKKNPMVNKTPAAETIAKDGRERMVSMGDEKKKLDVVPKKKEESDSDKKDVKPLPPNPFVQPKEEEKDELLPVKGAFGEELKVPKLKRHPVYPPEKKEIPKKKAKQ